MTEHRFKKGDPPANPKVLDSEYMSARAKLPRTPKTKMIKKWEDGLVLPADLLAELGFEDPADAPAALRLAAENAVNGNKADFQLFLRQSENLQPTPKAQPKTKAPDGRCPHCHKDMGTGPEVLVLSKLAIKALKAARILALEEALSGFNPEHDLLHGQQA